MSEPQTQPQLDGGNRDGGIVTTGTPDPWDEDTVKMGDTIAGLTLTQCAELSEYLERKLASK
jgi:hypothetical protein